MTEHKGMRISAWLGKIPADFGQTNHTTLTRVFISALIGQLLIVNELSSLATAQKVALFFLGLLLWTFEEYVLHRFSFHSKSEHPWVRPFNSGLHLLHHRSPANDLYLGAPLILSIPVYLLTLATLRMLSGTWDRAILIGCGINLGFVIYERVHFKVHQPGLARGPLMRYLKKHHMAHHFIDRTHRFGVTSPVWDFLFQSLKKKQKQASAS